MPSQRASSRVSRLTCHTGCRPTIDSAGTQAAAAAPVADAASDRVGKRRAGCGWAIASRTPGSWASISSASTSDSRRAALVCGPRRHATRLADMQACRRGTSCDHRAWHATAAAVARRRLQGLHLRVAGGRQRRGAGWRVAAGAAPASQAARASAQPASVARYWSKWRLPAHALPAQVHAQHAASCCQRSRPSTSMPSSGASPAGQAVMTQALGRTAALELQVGHTRPCPAPRHPPSATCTVPSAGSPSAAPALRDGRAGGAGVDQEVHAAAVDGPGQW
jgi:hypothetical protein